MSTRSAAEPHYQAQLGQTMLGKSILVKGQIFSCEDLTIDGEVEGIAHLPESCLTVGPHGKINASVKAREIVVLGAIHGNVETTDKIDIRKEGKLVGDIRTARIVIEDGAYFKGNIDIVRGETQPTPKPQQTAGAPATNMEAIAVDAWRWSKNASQIVSR
jgi:cytoskeletal protein CcmA (bactofilin family)